MESKEDHDGDPGKSSVTEVENKVRFSGMSSDRRTSGIVGPSRGDGAVLLEKVRRLKPGRAEEIVETLQGEGPKYVSGLLASEHRLASAVETVSSILGHGPVTDDVKEADFTVVGSRRRNRQAGDGRARAGRARARGGRVRGRGGGRRQPGPDAGQRGPRSVGASKKPIGSGAKLAVVKSLTGATSVSGPKPKRQGTAAPSVSAWARKLKVKEWGSLGDDEKSEEAESDGDGREAVTEDPMEDTYPVDPALEKAVNCAIRRRKGTVWGYIVWVRNRVASIVYGENSMLELRLPTRGKLAALSAGSAVVITVRKVLHPDGHETVSHGFAKYPEGWVGKPTTADLPRVKAVVTSIASLEGEVNVGEAVIPLTGLTGRFRAPHHKSVTIGASFMFTPTFEGVVMVIGDLPATCELAAPASKDSGPLATRADLAEGFLCPERQLQCVVQRKLNVDMMPFVGRSQTVFKYCHGADLARAFRNGGKAKRMQAVHLKDIEEVLVKAYQYRSDRPESEESRLQAQVAALQGQLSTQKSRVKATLALIKEKEAASARKGQAVCELDATLAGEAVPSEEATMLLQCLRDELAELDEASEVTIGLAKTMQAEIDGLQGELGALEARLVAARAVAEQEVLKRVQDQHKHFYVPTAQNHEAFAKWVKRDLERAHKEGERLQVVVGVFVDEECTLGSLYNSEDVPYFNIKMYPWATSFTLVGSPTTCYTLGKQGNFVPSQSTRRGKRVLLVELDSRYKASGTLPKPSLLKLHQPGLQAHNIVSAARLQSREFVLVSLSQDDPRFRILRDRCKASVYRKKGNLVVLACPFNTLADAEKYALNIAEKPRGMFGMLKRDLYSPNTLTLTCSGKRPVTPEELFFLTNAMGVLPIGGDRYRISTNMKLLEVAQMLHFHNEYIQKDLRKFISLRDDKERYVMLDTKKPPRNVKEYYRLKPALEQKASVTGVSWYHMTNLPNGITTEVLLEALSTTQWWPSDSREAYLMLDSGSFQPEAWFTLPTEVVVPISAVIANRPAAIIQADAPCHLQQILLRAEAGARSGSNPLDILSLGERELSWKPTFKMKSVVEKKISGRARALERAVPQNCPKILSRKSRMLSSQSRLPDGASPAPRASDTELPDQSGRQERIMTPVVGSDNTGSGPGDPSLLCLQRLAPLLPGAAAARTDLVESYLEDLSENALRDYLEDSSSFKALAREVMDYVRDELAGEGYYPDDGDPSADDSAKQGEGGPLDAKLKPVHPTPSSGVGGGVIEGMSTSEQSDEGADTPLSPKNQGSNVVRPGSESDKSGTQPTTGRKRGMLEREGPDPSQGFFPQEETMKRTKKAPLDRFISALNNTLTSL